MMHPSKRMSGFASWTRPRGWTRVQHNLMTNTAGSLCVSSHRHSEKKLSKLSRTHPSAPLLWLALEELETICMHYSKDGTLHESFLQIGSPEDTTSAGLLQFVKDAVTQNGIQNFDKKLVYVASDGASNTKCSRTGLTT